MPSYNRNPDSNIKKILILFHCTNILTLLLTLSGLSGPYARVLFAPSFTGNAVQGNRLVTGKPGMLITLLSLSFFYSIRTLYFYTES